jgi:hypothetical protein
MTEFNEYRPFPDPRKSEYLHAPYGPGVYDLRHIKSKQNVLFGISGRCAHRMSSLLPKPLGTGTRNNDKKRDYLLENIGDIEYRTCACKTRDEAAKIEQQIKQTPNNGYIFNT